MIFAKKFIYPKFRIQKHYTNQKVSTGRTGLIKLDNRIASALALQRRTTLSLVHTVSLCSEYFILRVTSTCTFKLNIQYTMQYTIYRYRAVTRNLVLGGHDPVLGGHSLLNKFYSKKFWKIYIKFAQKFTILKKRNSAKFKQF